MTWINNLYDTYEKNLSRVGVIEQKGNQEYTLMPIAHTTQTAHIEVSITENGEFHSARVLDKIITLIPATESSSSRSGSKIAPYPLHDKLSYVAGDLEEFGGGEKEKKQFSAYLAQLQDWVESSSSHPKIKTVYRYISGGNLIKDLVQEGILVTDNGKLVIKWNKSFDEKFGSKPELFSKVTGDVTSAFVRFNVYSAQNEQVEIWNDKDIHNSFVEFYLKTLTGSDYCFVTGKYEPITERHANKIRNSADKAKLISSNDKSEFTFRGRFDKSIEAASISYEVSQKAHNALKWLINRQGKIVNERLFLVWGNEDLDIIAPDLDTISIIPRENIKKNETNTLKGFANEVSKAIDGYKSDLNTRAEVNILILDAATQGRMSVQYYKSIDKGLYLDRIKNWHQSCVWKHDYRKDKNKEILSFYGAPSTKDIAYAAYGRKANEKVIKSTMERMIPCIVENRRIPQDIIRSIVYRASNPQTMDNWEWRKTLSIACALLNHKEGIGVSLSKESKDRNYLFGRLLAVAYQIEKWAQSVQNEYRETNAERYMVSFSNKPQRTWKIIHDNLLPYKARLGGRATKLYDLIIEITDQFDEEDFNDKPLDGKYLLGFSSQVMDLDKRKHKDDEGVDLNDNFRS